MKAKEFSMSALDSLEAELACAIRLLGVVQRDLGESVTGEAASYADALYALKMYLTRLDDELGDLVFLGKAAGL